MSQSTFLAVIQRCIEQHQLIQTGEHIYVAVSGGADSVALLTALYLLGYEVSVLHCNFHLREEESDGDEQFVRGISERLNIPFYIQHYDTNIYAHEQGISIEMAARNLRYAWFMQILRENPNSKIAIAHNADDVLETFMLNLSKGTSIRGLSGMPYKRNGGIIRPLMDLYRSDIEQFISCNTLLNSFRIDSSNQDTIYQRNYIRHKLLPLFEELNPSYKTSIRTTIEQLRGVEAFYLESINRYKEAVFNQNTIDIERLLLCPSPQTLLFELLYPYGFTSQQCRDIMNALPTLPSGGKFYSENYRLIRSWDFLEVLPKYPPPFEPISFTIQTLPFKVKIDEDRSLFITQTSQIEHTRHCLYLPFSDKEKTFTLRQAKEGERIQPFGMQYGSKKISRILIDNKATQKQRERALLLLCDDKPLWLLNFCKTEHTRLLPHPTYIKIELQ